MAKGRPRRAKQKAPRTPIEKLNALVPGFIDSSMSMGNEDIKNLIVKLELQDKEMEEAMAKDEDLQDRLHASKSAQEQVKIAKETYSLPLKTNTLKRRFLAETLEERGKASADEVVK